MIRLFCAIDLPERIIDDITDTYQAIPGARWMREEQLHVTLRFFGEVAEDRAETIVAALRTVTRAPFSLALKGAGCFPPRGAARILWIGIADEPRLIQLQARIEQVSVQCGIPREGRRFSPHITVARCGGAHPDRVAHFVVGNALFATEPFEVSGFHLYESHLGKNGAHYTRLASFPFTGRPEYPVSV